MRDVFLLCVIEKQQMEYKRIDIFMDRHIEVDVHYYVWWRLVWEPEKISFEPLI